MSPELQQLLEEFFEADKVKFENGQLHIEWRAYCEGFKEFHTASIKKGQTLAEVLPSIQEGLDLGVSLYAGVQEMQDGNDEEE